MSEVGPSARLTAQGSQLSRAVAVRPGLACVL